MPATTPPKGRPTAGKRDRQLAQRTWRSRNTTRKFIWVVLAVAVGIAVLVLGSGTGGNGNFGNNVNSNSAIPLLLLGFSTRRRRLLDGEPS